MQDLVTAENGKVITTSQKVAESFGKDHRHVLESIRKLLADLPNDFTEPNFRSTFQTVEMPNGATRKDPAYHLTRDGFTLLAMGFTGKRALQFKLAYIEAFNKMEQALQKASLPSDRSRIVQPVDLAAIGLIVKRYTEQAVTKALTKANLIRPCDPHSLLVTDFLKKHCVADPYAVTSAREAYERFLDYCMVNDAFLGMSKNRFGRILYAIGMGKARSYNGSKAYLGFKIQKPPVDDYWERHDRLCSDA